MHDDRVILPGGLLYQCGGAEFVVYESMGSSP